ncbi:unnamed protein product [Calicophoron daubneyi]|uniref:EF-hand domain-containing protein n=1 Tax=Calicophoron daubneyi TaxID=300641 RepID=A0AAV2TTJ6_CALDB
MKPELARKLLTVLDTDGNGKISKQELKKFLTMSYKSFDQKEIDRFYKEHDLDKDGEMDLEEVIKAFSTPQK